MYCKRHIISLLLLAFFASCFSCKDDIKPPKEISDKVVSTESDPVIQGISQLVDASPNSHELYAKRGELLYDRERYIEAQDDLNKAIELKDDIPQYYHLLADIQLDGSQSKLAIKTMERVIKKYPDRIPSYLKLSEFLLILKQYDQSLNYINEIIRQDPQNADAYFLLGMNFRDMGDEQKALNSLQRSVEIDADMVDAWILLGNIYEKRNDPQAKRYYQNAIDSDPNNILSLHSMADYLRGQEKIPEAIDAYNSILNIDPRYYDAHLNAGILNLSIDSLDKALMHFNLLVAGDPTDTKAREYKQLTMELLEESE